MDLGCNDGFFSDLCFNSGVDNITGVDYDLDSLNNAYLKFKDQKKNFFAIYQIFQIHLLVLAGRVKREKASQNGMKKNLME